MGGEIKMQYYEDEVLKELEVDQEYTERQIKIFVSNNKNDLVISNRASRFSDNKDSSKLRVFKKDVAYVHQFNKELDGYVPPNSQKIIYYIG